MALFLFALFMLASYFVSRNVQKKFNEYSKIPIERGLSGAQVAQMMLDAHDIHNVTIQMSQGTLTDHYNPTNRTLNLSPEVFNGRSVAAAAVAAHECGHAIQHAEAYRWLTLRSSLVPVVSFANQWMQWVLLAGVLLVKNFPQLLLVGIILFGMTTLFSLVTLPVEINASQRALAWLSNSQVTSRDNHQYAESALRAAAYTYVVAALTSLATLLYYIQIYLGGRR